MNGFGARGPSDILTPLLVQRLQQRLGQPFVVANRPGAGGNISMEAGTGWLHGVLRNDWHAFYQPIFLLKVEFRPDERLCRSFEILGKHQRLGYSSGPPCQ